MKQLKNRTDRPVRKLAASELGLLGANVAEDISAFLAREPGSQEVMQKTLTSIIPDDDPIHKQVVLLLADGYAGVILFGPPGTSKSWYARQLAAKMTGGDLERVRFVQFHPSYQYEDFVEAFAPNESGGIEPFPKLFLELCDEARKSEEETFVLVIDEFSRCDVVRVFGEALTYLETSKRDQEFRLSSGTITTVPKNLVIIATMNPWDRGVDEVDLALERRFAKIALDPDPKLLSKILSDNGLEEGLRRRVEQFFFKVFRHPNPYCRIGHAYFQRATDEETLRRLWDHQLRFHFDKVLQLDREEFKSIEAAWIRIFESGGEVKEASVTERP